MRLLITGGTGFIASQLAREASARGHDVVVTGLLNSASEQERADRLASAGISVIDGSLRVPAFSRRITRDCDAVVHLGAAQHAIDVPDHYFFDVNVEATRLLLESCVRARVRRFVHASTIGVYGSVASSIITEDTPIAPDDVYGESKAAAERVVRSFNDRLETTIARIGETYGPEDLRLLKLFKAARRGVSLIVGDGRNLHQPIHVQDLVRALLLAVEHPAAKRETFLFAGPAPITSRDMLNTISAVMATPTRHVRLPLFALIGAARISESACRRISMSPPIPMRRLDFFRKSLSFQIGKARAVLGFEPAISFSAGVRDTFDWYCAVGYLSGAQATGVNREIATTAERPHLAAEMNAHLAHIKQARTAQTNRSTT